MYKLQTNKACGPDQMGNTVLKHSPASSKSLMLIFKTATNKGSVPSNWKISDEIFIFRYQNRALTEPYCPISLLRHVSKVLENLIFEEVYIIVKKKTDGSQNGLHTHGTRAIQPLLFPDLLYNELDEEENETFVLYLDFEKAYDSVPHNLLLQKRKM